MSDQMSDADKIRSKRLAKLGGSQKSPNTDAESTSKDTTGQTPTSSSSNASPQPAPSVSQAGKERIVLPSLNSNKLDTPDKAASINIRPSSNLPAKRNSDSLPRSRSQASHETPEAWENRTLSTLFRVTLDPARISDAHGQPLQFLKGVKDDMESEGKPLRLSASQEVLEQAIVEAASNQSKKTPLRYLLSCWKRICRTSKALRIGEASAARLEVLKEARRLCFSYCVFAVTVPGLFDAEETDVNGFCDQLLLTDPENDEAIDYEFLQEATQRFDEDPSVKETFVQAAEQLSEKLAGLSMNEDYTPYIQALLSLLRFPPLVVAISESPKFLPADVAAQDIEKKTFLGPYFQLSPLQPAVAQNYFAGATARDRGFIANSQNALRMTLQQHQRDLFDIVDRFIKNKESREKMLDWLALTVNANHKRRAMRTDPRFVSTDGFMVNVTVCLDRLSEPFMDASFSKIDRIDVNYLRRSPRVKIHDETKINADQSASDKFYAEKAEGTSNFISEIFFLTAAAHHYGTEAAQTKLTELHRTLKHLDKEIEKFEAQREQFLGNPAQLTVFEMRLKAIKAQQAQLHAVLMATEGVLLDEQLQARAMSFMRYIIVWLMRLVSAVNFPKENVDLPLALEQPPVFSCLPEYFLEDVVDHFKFLTSHMPHVISPTQCDELVMMCITFLRSSEYIKNPGLKSGMVVILFYGVNPTRTSTNGPLGGILNALPFALRHLLHSLMKAFIECESTGTHTQFYDKFSTRYEIFQVIKCIWANELYRGQLQKEASQNIDFFVRFVNLLLNDATFLLDEIFSSFEKVASLEKELGVGKWAASAATLSEEDTKDKEEALEESKRKAKSYMQLTTETLEMLKKFTDALANAFTMPEVVQRLADMLDYNLDTLAGARRGHINVQNKQELSFNPAMMLSDLVDIFLNLAHKPSFHLAVARDGRSYKPENFDTVANLLSRFAYKSPEELAKWRRLAQDIALAKAEDDAEEEDLGEIPDEYLDPLLATLMTDPVILPTSKTVVDRSTIRQMLLSDAHDPFNRAPLKMEDVVDDVDLREKIDAFRKEKRGKRKAEDAAAAAAEQESMDTSAG